VIEAFRAALVRAVAPFDSFADALAAVDLSRRVEPAGAASLPVCRHWDAALADGGELAAALAALAPALRWHQTYTENPPAPDFLDEYGYAEVIGPGTRAPALVRSGEVAAGVLLLGPRTLYPEHSHPAEELYLPLGESEWLRGHEGWVARFAGEVVHHPPWVEHATRTGERPLAAVYVWRGDVDTPARLAR
jgi:hypothetical protein